MSVDKVLAEKIVNFLNELVEIDKPALAALITNRVPCNEDLADHATVQVMSRNDGFSVGLLGVLNGLCGIYENGYGPIAAEFDEGKIPSSYSNLTKFRVLTPKDME